jgi:hypothetical protein
VQILLQCPGCLYYYYYYYIQSTTR